MADRFTRRKLGGALLGSAAAFAQTSPQVSRSPDEELEAARQQNRKNGEALRKVRLPMAAEPAFHFSV